MALQIKQQYRTAEGTTGRDSADEFNAIVYGTHEDGIDNEAAVVQFAMSKFGPISEFGNVLHSVVRKRISPCAWLITANYAAPEENKQTNDASFSFSTGGSTQHIRYSRKTIKAYDSKGRNGKGVVVTFKAPNHHGAINVTRDGIEGTDVHVPTFDFKTTHFMAPATMNTAYVERLRTSTACVNNDEVDLNIDGVVLKFKPGELLLLGADGQKRAGYGDWELGLSWSGSKNVTNLSIGDDGTGNPAVTGIEKNGWDYMWVYFGTSGLDTVAHATVSPITGVYIERIYEYVNLSGILPTSAFGVGNVPGWMVPVTYAGPPNVGLIGI